MIKRTGYILKLDQPAVAGYTNASLVRHGRSSPDFFPLGLQTLVFEANGSYYVAAYGDDSCLEGFIPLTINHPAEKMMSLPPGKVAPPIGSPAQFAVVGLSGNNLVLQFGDCAEIAGVVGSPAFAETRAALAHHPEEEQCLGTFLYHDFPIFTANNPTLLKVGRGTTGPTEPFGMGGSSGRN